METLGQTTSVCGVCRAPVPAKVVVEGGVVSFRKFCPEHGESLHRVHGNVKAYLSSQRYVKPAWIPRSFAGDEHAPCPEGCGFCARHEQHLCMPIIEITSRCDLACPACLVNAGGTWDMPLDTFGRVLDGLIGAERQIDVLNLSGGEPTRHPQFLALVDAALARPEIVRVSVSTNGLRFLEEPALLRELCARRAVVALQLDGFDEQAYVVLRGCKLLDRKRRILDLLAGAGVSTSLTMTLAAGLNEGQLPAMLDYLFSHGHVLSMMVQPLAFAGRGAAWAEGARHLSASEVVELLGGAGHPAVAAEDFVPLPCCHPLCFSLACYLMLDSGRALSVAQMIKAATVMDTLANRAIFGLDAGDQARVKELIYEVWSGPAGLAPDSAELLGALRHLLREVQCSCSQPRELFSRAERRLKTIFIHAFQDAGTFDLARVRRCCNGYPQPDGRVIPACVRNVCRPGIAGMDTRLSP